MAQDTSTSSAFATYCFAAVCIVLVGLGWWQRDDYWFSPERGWGYAFGIIGGSMMLVLLLYPLRKKVKLMRNWFNIRHWFRLHMILGILGPLLVLFHSNFHLGSLNSTIAFSCMLLVAGSGLIGRYVYRQIHRGLYGELIRFDELKENYAKSRAHFLGSDLVKEETTEKLTEVEKLLMNRQITLWQSWRANHTVSGLRRSIKKQIKQNIRKKKFTNTQATQLKEAYENWNRGVNNLLRMSKFAFNSNLFSLWHVLHLPFFFMMIITAIVHVVVVHMY